MVITFALHAKGRGDRMIAEDRNPPGVLLPYISMVSGKLTGSDSGPPSLACLSTYSATMRGRGGLGFGNMWETRIAQINRSL